MIISLMFMGFLLNNYNKNDLIKVMFDGENDKFVFTYKIISKTTDNNYICEFIY